MLSPQLTPAAWPRCCPGWPTPCGRLLYALDEVDELCVGDLALGLDATEDAVGHGLKILRTHCFRQLVAISRVDQDDEEDR